MLFPHTLFILAASLSIQAAALFDSHPHGYFPNRLAGESQKSGFNQSEVAYLRYVCDTKHHADSECYTTYKCPECPSGYSKCCWSKYNKSGSPFDPPGQCACVKASLVDMSLCVI